MTRRVVLWGASPRRAVYVGSREDRRRVERLDREAARSRNLSTLVRTVRPFEVRVGPGDVIVLQADHALSEDELRRLREAWKAAYPTTKVALLDGGIRFEGVIRDAAPSVRAEEGNTATQTPGMLAPKGRGPFAPSGLPRTVWR